MKQRIEQFWTEAESLLNSDKKLIDKISEIENLIRERLERFELINYDAEFNLVKESGIENLANQQKEKIIKNIWNPLFNEATTFQEYSYLLNWVIPVNKWYSFCGDYELTDKTYDVLAEVIDENASLDDIIFILRSIFFLKNKKINIVLGTGGYMSVAICIAAKILNIKIYLFEPNMVIGRANKFLLKFSNKIFCYSDEIINFPKKNKSKIVFINHVLRKEIYNFDKYNKEKIENKIKLLVVGGSQGAKVFDEDIKNSILDLSKKYKLIVYHQVSSLDFSDLEFFYKENNIENKLFNFEENVFQYINEANLAITRAGASTLSELAFLKVPFIAIPYKFATDNHQLQNALHYEYKGCCWILEEKEFNQHKLTALLINIIENRDDYLNKKNNLEKFCYQNTWNKINEKVISSLNEN